MAVDPRRRNTRGNERAAAGRQRIADLKPMSIRVGIVEDDSRLRETLALLIDRAQGFSCAASCASAEEALRQLPGAAPDVVLMDIHLPGASGIECVARLRRLLPRTQVIMLTIEEDIDRVFESLKAGATGYLVKHVRPEEILEAVAEVQHGGAPMSSAIARRVVTAFRQPPCEGGVDEALTMREEGILRLLAKGCRSKEVADHLQIGIGTVNTHVRHIYWKLHVRSRAEAVARYMAR